MAAIRAAILVSATITAPVFVFEPHLKSSSNPQAIEEHELRRMSQLGQAGSMIYYAHCEGCHGAEALGTALGPSLRRKVFHRGDHMQKEFHLALNVGSDLQGGMHRGLPASELSFNEIEQVARYVRDVRRVEYEGD